MKRKVGKGRIGKDYRARKGRKGDRHEQSKGGRHSPGRAEGWEGGKTAGKSFCVFCS